MQNVESRNYDTSCGFQLLYRFCNYIWQLKNALLQLKIRILKVQATKIPETQHFASQLSSQQRSDSIF